MEQEKQRDLLRRLNKLQCNGMFEISSEPPHNIIFVNNGILWNIEILKIMELVKMYDAMIYIAKREINIHG